MTVLAARSQNSHVTVFGSIQLVFRKSGVLRIVNGAASLVAAGQVPRPKFSARRGVGKVSNYINMLPVGYYV
jgi:hypothetical protein